MKVALNPAELRLIVDAFDDKHQFQLHSRGGEGGVGKRSLHRLQPGIGASRIARDLSCNFLHKAEIDIAVRQWRSRDCDKNNL